MWLGWEGDSEVETVVAGPNLNGFEQEAAVLHRVGVRTAAAKRLSLNNFEQTAVVRLWELGMGARLRELEAQVVAAAVRLYVTHGLCVL